MALDAVNPRAVFIGSGTRGPFALQTSGQPWRVRDENQLVVRRYSSVTDEDGTLLVVNTDFTCSNTDVDDVEVTLASSQAVLASTERLEVERTQEVAGVIDLTLGGDFSAPALAAAISVQTEQIQELRRDVDRRVKLDWRQTSAVELPLPPTSGVALLGRNTSGAIVHAESADFGDGEPVEAGWLEIISNKSPFVTPEQYGASDDEDGDTDETAAIIDAINAANGRPVFFRRDRWYGIDNRLTLPASVDTWLLGPRLKQLATQTDSDCRTIFANTGSGKIRLDRPVINRNGTIDANDAQAYSDSAGIWINGRNGVEINDAEIYGHGQGNGWLIIGGAGHKVIRPNVHDMTFYAAVDPATEKLAAGGFSAVTDSIIKDFYISTLLSKFGVAAATTKQTDGYDIGGSSRVVIDGGFGVGTNELIDITGSALNSHILIKNIIGYRQGSATIKLANSFKWITVRDCDSIEPGWAGFGAIGPSELGQTLPRFVKFINCKTYNPGSTNSRHTVRSVYNGFQIQDGAAADAVSYPRDVDIIDCEAIDDQGGSATMTAAVFFDGSHANSRNILIRNLKTSGATVGRIQYSSTNYFGEYQRAKVRISGSAVSHATSGAWQKVVWNSVEDDDNVLVVSGTFTAKVAGEYHFKSAVCFANNTTGYRATRLKKNSSTVKVSAEEPVVSDVTSVDLNIGITLAAGDTLELEAFQSSGGALDMTVLGSWMHVTRIDTSGT